MYINLVYEINNRDYINCVLLERELNRRGYKVRICCKDEDYILSNKESWTVIPNSLNNKNVDHYRYTFNAKGNLIMYPCEQVINNRLPKTFDHSDSNEVKKMPILCWGPDYYEFIKSLNFDMSICKIVGAIQLDLARPEFKSFYMSREEIANQYGLPKDKKWVLFISDFIYDSEKRRDIGLKKGARDRNEIINRYEHEKKTCQIIIDWLEKLLKNRNDCIVIYRKHPIEFLIPPVEELRDKYPDRFFTISELNIKEWINCSDVITTWYSTAGIEAYVARKDVILLRPSDIPPETGMRDYIFYEQYPKVCCEEDFLLEISEERSNERHKCFKIDNLYSFTEKPSFIRVADAIEEIIKNKTNRTISKDYNQKRIVYLIKNKTIMKNIVKRVYQFLYMNLKIRSMPLLDKRYSTDEWKESIENKRRHYEWASRIDRILELNYSRKN